MHSRFTHEAGSNRVSCPRDFDTLHHNALYSQQTLDTPDRTDSLFQSIDDELFIPPKDDTIVDMGTPL